MRAWQVQRHGPPLEAFELVELDEPTPGPGELRIRVRAAAIGMPDAFMCRSTYALTPPLPFVPGQEVCGVVDACGPGVDWPIGSRVMAVTSFTDGRGGFADVTVARAASTYRVPDSMSDVDAAGFRIGYGTAWIGLVRRGQLRSGEWLLVLGAAGGSGITAIQLGKALGARVVAVASDPARLEFCRRMGADVLIDRTAEAVPAAVLRVTEGRGADVIYDPVGGEPAEAALRCVAPGGRVLAIGFASGRWIQVDTAHAVRRNYSLVGVYAGGYSREEGEADHEALLAHHAAGDFTSFTSTVAFAQVPAAVQSVLDNGVTGKLIVDLGS
jgi:NADPH2:quinone reductase